MFRQRVYINIPINITKLIGSVLFVHILKKIWQSLKLMCNECNLKNKLQGQDTLIKFCQW
jgi:hypothetical protein